MRAGAREGFALGRVCCRPVACTCTRGTAVRARVRFVVCVTVGWLCAFCELFCLFIETALRFALDER